MVLVYSRLKVSFRLTLECVSTKWCEKNIVEILQLPKCEVRTKIGEMCYIVGIRICCLVVISLVYDKQKCRVIWFHCILCNNVPRANLCLAIFIFIGLFWYRIVYHSILAINYITRIAGISENESNFSFLDLFVMKFFFSLPLLVTIYKHYITYVLSIEQYCKNIINNVIKPSFGHTHIRTFYFRTRKTANRILTLQEQLHNI